MDFLGYLKNTHKNPKCVVPENIQTHHGGNLKFQGGGGGGGVRGPGNSRGEGGWTIKSLSGGKYHFIFDLSSNIASYRTVRSFLEHK